jgi:alkylated DNA repair dioxygenase AlkB
LQALLAVALQQTASRSDLLGTIQKSYKPLDLLTQVGPQLNINNDKEGEIGSLSLVRLSKQLVSIDNQHYNQPSQWAESTMSTESLALLDNIITHTFLSCNIRNAKSAEAAVEATKACGIISRLMVSTCQHDMYDAVSEFWSGQSVQSLQILESHHLSGLQWAFDCLNVNGRADLPADIQPLITQLKIPFRIHPALLKDVPCLSVDQIRSEVNFQADYIQTASNRVTQERRLTAWEGDAGVLPFEYSGKMMPRRDWSPIVEQVRNVLEERLGQYYDCCLLNLYPDASSGMRYHIDPDQGRLWDFDTSVISVGASRRFAFRSTSASSAVQPHNFVVMHGDVTHMFGDCQTTYQHTVKRSENKDEWSVRSSLVYKRSLRLQRS